MIFRFYNDASFIDVFLAPPNLPKGEELWCRPFIFAMQKPAPLGKRFEV